MKIDYVLGDRNASSSLLSTMVLLVLLIVGCSSEPRVLSRAQYDVRSQEMMMLSSYHNDYLGSDDTYHLVRLGIATGSTDYRVPKQDLSLKDEYPYVPKKPRIEPLLPRLKK